ncbi:MAG: hypothetical protein AMJ46_06850 [Latescibacteria bacterium DG_63]|nr:MAG: hypothetical protein AMJ46_06850 [Latescibacteria bacterium DG_63]
MSVLRWSVLPARRSKKKTWGLLIFLGVFLTLLYIFYGMFASGLAILLLGVSLLPFFLKTQYELNEDGLIVKKPYSRMKKEWSHFGSYYPDKNGVLLSPFSKPSRLENFRGVYILFGDRKDEILTFIKRKVGAQKPKESE